VSTPTSQSPPEHGVLEHDGSVGARLNWLRAGVLGANDGIVSVAGIVVGVAGATTDRVAILTAGVAGLAAGALSMASGEYVSVSTQRDTERALLAKEARELREMPEEELAELIQIYRDKGLSDRLAREVAVELTEHDAFAAHVDAELGIDPDNLTNPWHAAFASAVAFICGALLPLLAVLLPGASARVPVTFAAVLLALVATGLISAALGDAKRRRAIWRNVAGGLLAMVVTYGVGQLLGGLVF
jgi:VIT1/CCC1 family predicted Fe2+/Mn2+ transporter